MFKKLLLLAALAAPLCAVEETLPEARKLYKAGKLPEAVSMLENLHSKNKNDIQIKDFLVKALTELGIDLSFKENYEGAVMALGRAHELAPDDKSVSDMLDTARQLAPPPGETAKEPPAQMPKKKTGEAPTPVPAARSGPAVIASSPGLIKSQKELIKKMETLAEVFRKNTEVNEKTSGDTLKKLDRLINEGSATNRTIREAIGHTESTFKKTFMYYTLSFLAAAGIVIVVLFFMLRSAALRRREFFAAAGHGLEGPGQSAKRIPVEVEEKSEEAGKFEGIEIIEAELSSDDRTETSVARKLLDPFLKDRDVETRVRAVRALHKYDSEEAGKLINSFSSSQEEEDKRATCRLINLMPPDAALSAIEKISENAGPELRKDCLKALAAVRDSKISDDLKRKFDGLAARWEKKGWIVS